MAHPGLGHGAFNEAANLVGFAFQDGDLPPGEQGGLRKAYFPTGAILAAGEAG